MYVIVCLCLIHLSDQSIPNIQKSILYNPRLYLLGSMTQETLLKQQTFFNNFDKSMCYLRLLYQLLFIIGTKNALCFKDFFKNIVLFKKR